MVRPEKQKAADALRETFAKTSSAVFVNYVGMKVSEIDALRTSFRAKGIEYKVVKNTLVKKALANEPWIGSLNLALKGMTGIAWSFEEPSAAARVLKEATKETQKPVIKAGLLEGTVLDARAVETQLATLPNKDEARAMLLATFMAPAQQMVMVLNAPGRNFVGVLAAKQRQAESK
jgi:large subunit ribosomal protein L10